MELRHHSSTERLGRGWVEIRRCCVTTSSPPVLWVWPFTWTFQTASERKILSSVVIILYPLGNISHCCEAKLKSASGKVSRNEVSLEYRVINKMTDFSGQTTVFLQRQNALLWGFEGLKVGSGANVCSSVGEKPEACCDRFDDHPSTPQML